jgi:hypothetical protein
MTITGRRTASVSVLLLAAVLTVGAPGPAQAQDGKVGLYAGYAFLKTDEGNFHGARLSPEFRLNGFTSMVGDFSWEKGTVSKASARLTTYLGGLRFKRSVGSVGVFVHALAGGVRSSSSVSPFGGVTISVSESGLGLDGGGGLEFNLGSSLKMRLGADYLRRRIEAGGVKINENDIRATAGFVF